MYVTPTSQIATAVRENLRRAVANKEDCWEFNQIEPSGRYFTSFKIRDQNGIIMYAYKNVHYKLNNLNGPAFYHVEGNKKIFFINNEAYSEFDYNRHYAIKFIKNLKLKEPNQPIVGPGRYWLADYGTLEISINYSGSIKLKTYNSKGDLHNENGPAVVDFAFYHMIEYYRNGELHNSTGPAVLKLNKDSNVETQELFFLGGKELTENEFKLFAKDYDSTDINLYTDLTGI